MSDANPYAPPEAELDAPPQGDSDLAQAVRIREAHLNHETNLKAVGSLYYLGAVLMVPASMTMCFLSAAPGTNDDMGFLGVSAVYFIMALISTIMGRGLRKLRSWVKIPAAILASVGLIAFPVGTVINGYVLYLLFSEKGRLVFSDSYQLIITQTPHIKYKTPIIAWIFLFLILGGLVLLVGGLVTA